MAFFPCPNFSDCVPPAEGVAVRNLTAELPDRPSFFGYYQCSDIGVNPPFTTCESIVSQEQSDFCAARCLAEGIFVSEEQTCTGPCGSTFTLPAGTILANSVQEANAQALAFACASVAAMCSATNSARTCSVTCPDSSVSTYTVPAGVLSAPSADAANNLAAQLACEIAGLQCFGALVQNTAQSCSAVCPNSGGTLSVTVPAGAVLGLTLASANARALEIACALALLACPELPPLVGNIAQTCSQTCNGETITQTVPAGAFVGIDEAAANQIAAAFCVLSLSRACQREEFPETPNVGNQRQACSIPCENGGTFTFTVGAGSFRAENLAAANAAAISYACSHAWNSRFCLSDIGVAGVCVNEVFAAVVGTTGPGTPTAIGVTSGALPPGLSFSGGMLSGIPTTAGSYTFTISAADSNGNSASRAYTITVAEIVTSTLPNADTSSPYAQAIAVNGFTNPVFSIVGGTLPPGIVLNPNTGVLSGTPTSTGTFDFVLQVSDS